MSKQLLTITSHYRAQLLQHEAQAHRQLHQAHQQALAAIQPHLDNLYKQIEAKYQEVRQEDEEAKISLSWLHEDKRIQSLKQVVAGHVDYFAGFAQMQAAHSQAEALALGKQAAQAQLKASGVDAPNTAHSADLSKLTDVLHPGSKRSKLFSGFGAEAAEGVASALKVGLSLGQSAKEIGKSVLGKLKTSLHRAVTVVTDAAVSAFNGAISLFYKANDDVVVGWIWICSFSNSCAACIAMHGSEHDLSEELDDHPCGHCTQAPLLASGASGIDGEGLDIQSGADWFDDQDEDTQRDILGPGKYDAWQNGDFSLDDIVAIDDDPTWGKSIREKPLKELVK